MDAPEEVKHVKIEPEEPVLEEPGPEKVKPVQQKSPAVPKERQKEKPAREQAVEKMLSQFDTVLEKEEDMEKRMVFLLMSRRQCLSSVRSQGSSARSQFRHSQGSSVRSRFRSSQGSSVRSRCHSSRHRNQQSGILFKIMKI